MPFVHKSPIIGNRIVVTMPKRCLTSRLCYQIGMIIEPTNVADAVYGFKLISLKTNYYVNIQQTLAIIPT